MNDNNHATMTFAINYPVNVKSLPVKGIRVEIDADEKERSKLAKNHGLLDVSVFFGEFQILPWKKRGIRVKGNLKADISQACIVTLEPVPQKIDENIEAVFVPDDSRLLKPETRDETGEIFLDAEGPDAPEVFHGDSIDVGMIMEEFFELAIDPYPRKSGAEVQLSDDEKQVEKKPSPFAILKQLK
ncbi:DUF177 domain-containing protein [Bartonella sp. LJL80]